MEFVKNNTHESYYTEPMNMNRTVEESCLPQYHQNNGVCILNEATPTSMPISAPVKDSNAAYVVIILILAILVIILAIIAVLLYVKVQGGKKKLTKSFPEFTEEIAKVDNADAEDEDEVIFHRD